VNAEAFDYGNRVANQDLGNLAPVVADKDKAVTAAVQELRLGAWLNPVRLGAQENRQVMVELARGGTCRRTSGS